MKTYKKFAQSIAVLPQDRWKVMKVITPRCFRNSQSLTTPCLRSTWRARTWCRCGYLGKEVCTADNFNRALYWLNLILVVQSILRGESVSTAPRRSRASAYRDRLPPPSKVKWDSNSEYFKSKRYHSPFELVIKFSEVQYPCCLNVARYSHMRVGGSQRKSDMT